MPPTGASSAHPQAFTERQFRDALAQFATGVTVICARAPATAATSASRPTRSTRCRSTRRSCCGAWRTGRRACAAFEAAERYSVNVLSHDQVELARRFSRPHADRFAGVPLPPGLGRRAAHRRLRRMVRVPPPRPPSRGRPRGVHRRGRPPASARRAAGSCSTTGSSARRRRCPEQAADGRRRPAPSRVGAAARALGAASAPGTRPRARNTGPGLAAGERPAVDAW